MTTTVPTNYAEAMTLLKAAVPTMEDRPQQDVAAKAIERTIQDGSILVCQAGTGVGKSNAALIPAITSGKRVVYATATKVLQSQIAEKDLPFLAEHLGIDFSYSSLKGWASYTCHAKLAEMQDSYLRQEILDAFEADQNHVGDRESLPVELDDRVWMDLSISSQECPGRNSCPFGSVCKPQAARDRAVASDVVVVNHSVLATDAIVQDATEGGFSLIGKAQVLIVDEAHELEEFISGVLGEQFTEGSIRHLLGMLRTFNRRISMDPDMESTADAISVEFGEASKEFFGGLKEGRLRHVDVVADPEPFERLLKAYAGLREFLISEDVRLAVNAISDQTDKIRARAARERMSKTSLNKIQALASILLQGDTDLVRFVEVQRKRYRGEMTETKVLKSTPVSVAPWAENVLWPLYEAVVLLSATVLVDGSSNYITSRLGIADATTLDAGTPFDYQRQALLYIPQHLPEPSGRTKREWTDQSFDEMQQLVTASGGGALLLFTSNTQLSMAWDAFAHNLPFQCKRQGDETNNRLMTWFREEHDGVLFATRSFFTGASFEGDTCRLVVIDKLPFPVPSDPIFEARSELIERNGGSSFAELSIPMMTLPLQQGFGRLIRTKSDRGVVAILDPRLKTKGYGSKIVRSLPPAKVSTNMGDVERFWVA